MLPRDVRKYLFDMAEAAGLIEQFVAGKSFEDYADGALLRSAVERQFGIVGEALNRALQLDPALEQRITHARRVVAFRSRLIHGYAAVSHETVWGAIETSLPVLVQELRGLLDDHADSEDGPPGSVP